MPGSIARGLSLKGFSLLQFRSLASGSSGNAFLLQTDEVRLLFDAGLPLVALRRFLEREGIVPESLTAVLLSHEHGDHCAAAADMATEHGTPLWANEQVLTSANLQDLEQATVLEVGIPRQFGDVEVTSFPVAHDAVCPVGFLVRSGGRTIVIATDLGSQTRELVEAVSAADLVVLEANHDLRMLHAGRYPFHLRKRVAGARGHLSNKQAAAILCQCLKTETVDVWLAHLSQVNNTQRLALKTVRSALKAEGLGSVRVEVASRGRPSLRWNGIPRPRQLSLFAGSEIG